jgi:hypothetical protein
MNVSVSILFHQGVGEAEEYNKRNESRNEAHLMAILPDGHDLESSGLLLLRSTGGQDGELGHIQTHVAESCNVVIRRKRVSGEERNDVRSNDDRAKVRD